MKTIKELRAMTGLSQSEFASRYHIKTATLQHWEQGVAKTPECVLFMLEQLLAPSEPPSV
jgi:putative transcriptional regulator